MGHIFENCHTYVNKLTQLNDRYFFLRCKSHLELLPKIHNHSNSQENKMTAFVLHDSQSVSGRTIDWTLTERT